MVRNHIQQVCAAIQHNIEVYFYVKENESYNFHDMFHFKMV